MLKYAVAAAAASITIHSPKQIIDLCQCCYAFYIHFFLITLLYCNAAWSYALQNHWLFIFTSKIA